MPIVWNYDSPIGSSISEYGRNLAQIQIQNARIEADRKQRMFDRIADAALYGAVDAGKVREQQRRERVDQAQTESRMRLGQELGMLTREADYAHDLDMFSNRSAFEAEQSKLDRDLRRGENAADRYQRFVEMVQDVTGRRLDREQRAALDERSRQNDWDIYRARFAGEYGDTPEGLDQYLSEAQANGIPRGVALGMRRGQLERTREQVEAGLLEQYNTTDFNEAMRRQRMVDEAISKTGKPHYWGVTPEAQLQIDGIKRQLTDLQNDPRAADPMFMQTMAPALQRRAEQIAQAGQGPVEQKPRNPQEYAAEWTYMDPNTGLMSIDPKTGLVRSTVKYHDTKEGRDAQREHEAELKRAADAEEAEKEKRRRREALAKEAERVRKEIQKERQGAFDEGQSGQYAEPTDAEVEARIRDMRARDDAIADRLMGEEEPSAFKASEQQWVITSGPGSEDPRPVVGTEEDMKRYAEETGATYRRAD